MKILILGGTVFVGRHLVLQALEQGHDVTLFNRGKSRQGAFPDIEQIHGDRDGGLDAVGGRHWDVVLDTCGYIPRIVRQSVQALSKSVDRYTFVSTISVYKIVEGQFTVAESDPVLTIVDPTVEQVTGDTYGPLKALCEAEVLAGFGDSAHIVRPGLIVGPDDPTDRFSYWVNRLSKGGKCPVPDVEDQPVQVVDVRDLARWMILSASEGVVGTMNAAAPETPYQLGAMLRQMNEILGKGTQLVPFSPERLVANDIGAWMDLPLYLGNDPEGYAMLRAEINAAVATGFTYRSLDETVIDTLDWLKTRPDDHLWKAGLSPEREAKLLNSI